VFVGVVGVAVEDSELRVPLSGVLDVVAELIIPPIHPCPSKTVRLSSLGIPSR
jgi:hypothetical protein